MMAELLTLMDVADMHLNRRNIYCLQCVQNCYAVMRKRRRIDNNAVKMTVSILNSGNYIALIIALQQLHLYAKAVPAAESWSRPSPPRHPPRL